MIWWTSSSIFQLLPQDDVAVGHLMSRSLIILVVVDRTGVDNLPVTPDPKSRKEMYLFKN